MKKLLTVLFALSMLMTLGCTSEVPPGYVGMVMTPEGLQGDVLAAGRHACWGRDKMFLLQTKEETVPEPMSILCKDDLNFKFDLNVRARLRTVKKASDFQELMNRKGSDMQDGILNFASLYNTYVKPVARSTARGIVSRYQTTDIRGARTEIESAILKQLQKSMEGTPMEVVTVTTSNFDYPDVITAAVEKKRQREIEIQEERANQAKQLLVAENRLKLAEKMKMVKAAEAEADAAAIRIMGKSLTPSYLKWKEIERDTLLYGKVGQGDKVIVTNGNQVSPMIGVK
jgi:regulator of protease activity HflC (stomatin/prohibitin superfamily)